jgi:hypothetical protein
VLVAVEALDQLDTLLTIAAALASPETGHGLVIGALASSRADLGELTVGVEQRRAELHERGLEARGAAFTTDDWAADVERLAARQDVSLVLVAMPSSVSLPATLVGVLGTVAADVAVLANASQAVGDGPVVVPFGGAEHDWAALEVGAWLASGLERALRLVGTEEDATVGRRDASRLLASASLAVQQLAGVPTQPSLVAPGARPVLEAAAGAAALVAGFSERWRQEGVGDARAGLAAGAGAPVLLVRRGPRPGGLTPPAGLTRFSWSLHAGARR